jgi:glycosyltransferase involved in cell wall biosynthesis
MRVKILNAMAQGIPIMSTTLGCEGIEVVPGESILVADEPADFADAALRLLDDADLAARLAADGRRLAERKQWEYY